MSQQVSLVERFSRTLKSNIWRMFTSRNNHKWLDELPKIVHAYIHSVRRVIKKNPANVNEESAIIISERLYGKDKRCKSTMKKIVKAILSAFPR